MTRWLDITHTPSWQQQAGGTTFFMYHYAERIVNELLDMMPVSGGDSEVNGLV